jgi:hypothetical protein
MYYASGPCQNDWELALIAGRDHAIDLGRHREIGVM